MPRWFDLFTDCLCIFTVTVLAGIALDNAFVSFVVALSSARLLYWWRRQR